MNIVKSPAFENKRLNWLVDIEVFSNGKVIDEFSVNKVQILKEKPIDEILGKVDRVVIT